MKTKKINSKIDAAATKAEGLVTKSGAKIAEVASASGDWAGSAQAKVAAMVEEGEHRLQERANQAGHTAKELATSVIHSAQETVQEVVHSAKEMASAAQHRRQELAHKAGDPRTKK